jgi:hypothetical protein
VQAKDRFKSRGFVSVCSSWLYREQNTLGGHARPTRRPTLRQKSQARPTCPPCGPSIADARGPR